LVEQLPLKQTVGGSNPSARTIDKNSKVGYFIDNLFDAG